MYVPGKLIDCEKVLVDIGTGYFVEKVRFCSVLLAFELSNSYCSYFAT